MEAYKNINQEQKRRYQLGVNVLIALGVLTVIEFAISMLGVTWVWGFIIIALVKGFLVIQNYMHASRLFIGEEHS